MQNVGEETCNVELSFKLVDDFIMLEHASLLQIEVDDLFVLKNLMWIEVYKKKKVHQISDGKLLDSYCS